MNRLFPPEGDAVGSIHDQLAHLAEIKIGMPVQRLTRDQIASFVETAFWASLRSNEGRQTRVSVTVAARERFSSNAVAFAVPVEYDEVQIVKLAPAVPRDGCLVVSDSNDGLNIWGFGRERRGLQVDTVTVEITEPGTIRVNIGPYRPFAVLNGRSASTIAGVGTDLANHLRRVLRKALPTDDFFQAQAVWQECLALADLTRMIRAQSHGGIVLIVGSETGEWLESLSSPFAYRFATPDTTIRDAIQQEVKDTKEQGKIVQRLLEMEISDDLKHRSLGALVSRREGRNSGVRATASLAGVDGAIVVTRDLKLLGFGAKINVGTYSAVPVCMFRPESGSQKVVPSRLEDLGGTRHQSAARFVSANKDAVAIVISQDGLVSVMQWDEQIKSVAVIRNAEWWV